MSGTSEGLSAVVLAVYDCYISVALLVPSLRHVAPAAMCWGGVGLICEDLWSEGPPQVAREGGCASLAEQDGKPCGGT